MACSGSQFAQLQLEKYGWKEGKGLGREEGGIKKALKPKLKFDSAGLGHDIAREYKSQWWDHAFNKAAASITVEKVQDGSVQLTRKELPVKKKKSTDGDVKTKFYGTFVKGGTLFKEKEEKENSESEESEDECDMSLTLTDEELFKICGKRTAHKGARHGLTMSAKLARVAEQERLLMEKWTTSEHFKQGSCKSEGREKKKKKKRKVKKDDVSEMNLKETNVKTPKKKKVKASLHEEPLLSSKDTEESVNCFQGKKFKKHNHSVTDSHLDYAENGSFVDSSSENFLMEHVQPTHLQNNDINNCSIKNKKKRKNKTVNTIGTNEYTVNGTEVAEKTKDKKRIKNIIDVSEYTVNGTDEPSEKVKEKKTKKKKCFDEKENKCAKGTEMIEKENGIGDFHSESVRERSRKKKYKHTFEAHQMEEYEISHVPHRKKKKKK